MADIDDVRSDISRLSGKLDSVDRKLEQIMRELGAGFGRVLAEQMNNLERELAVMKAELDKVKIDTTNIRRVQEYGSRDTQEIKKALAAIYRNTDELEKQVMGDGDRNTFA